MRAHGEQDAERPMKILMVIDSLRLGGAERVLATLSSVALPAGFEFEVLVLSPPDRTRSVMEPVLQDAGVSIRYLSLRRLADPRAVPRLVRAIRACACDVVHAHLEDAATLAPLAARMAGRPAVCSFHHVAVPLAYREAAKERLAVAAANTSARVVFVSRASLESFSEVYGGPQANWTIVENGVDLDAFASGPDDMPADLAVPPGAPVAAIVGALRGRKGHAVAMAAWPTILERIPDAHLLIVGDGPEWERLHELAGRLGISDRVRFAGTRTDVARLVRACALVLLPSEHEALPTTLIEAAACGRPAIASDVDGVPEVLSDGETGLLVPVHDAAALAGAAIELLGDVARRQAMGRNARALAERRFDSRRWAERLYEVYEVACRRRRAVSA
jgi:glycosyltransferase involved in cell wall biosynthesis